MDPYKIDETVYRNSFNLKNQDDVKFAENFWVELRLADLMSGEIEKVSYESLLDIHKYLFEGFYDWAGKETTVQVARNDNIQYTDIKQLRETGEKIIERFNKLGKNANSEIAAKVISNTLTGLWKNHSFRNGNLVTVLAFMKLATKKKGIQLNLSKLRTKSNLREAVKLSAMGKGKQLNLMVQQAMGIERGMEIGI